MEINKEEVKMKPINAVPLRKDSNDRLDAIVSHRQAGTHNRVTKISVIADLIDKAFKRECK